MQITLEQYRAQYARNAVSAQRRFEKVRDSGKNRTGYTLDELQAHADDARRFSLLPDEELRAHIAAAWNAASGGVLGAR